MKNLTTRLAVLLLSTLSLLTGAFGQFTPSQDSYTFNNKGNQNYGTAQAISVEYSVIAHPPAIENSYIQFDLSSIPSSYTGANVSKASLKLFVNFLSGAGGSFNVDLVNGSWTELGIKYNNAPALGTTIASSIPLTTANVNNYVIVDVTSAVQAWLDGTQSNDGIALVANSGLGVLFDSKENTATSHPPELDIVFASGGTITGITTTGSSGLIGGGTTGNLNLSLIPCSASQPILVWNGSGWSCSTVSGGGGSISGSGTVNSLSLFNGTTSLASSNVFQSGTNIGIGNPTPLAALDVTGAVNATTSFQIGGVPFGYGSSPAGNAFLGFAGNSNSNNTGQLNTAVGDLALFTNTTGQNNAASGAFALENNTTGNGNTASGVFALGLNTTGSNNSALGYFAGSDLITTLVNNATAIGAFADVTQSNSLVLGGITGMNGCTAQNNCASVRVGIGTTAPQYTLDVNGTANFTGAVNFANNTVGSSTVFGNNTATTGFGTNGGSFSTASSAGTGVVGQNFSAGGGYGGYFSSASATGTGLYAGNTTGGVAGFFSGSVQVTGAETVGGNLTSSGVVTGSSFQIGSNLFGFGSYLNQNAFLGFAGNNNPSNTGSGNSAFGVSALLSNTTGNNNIASGFNALLNNTTGWGNTAVGDFALDKNTTGSNNTALGILAGSDATTPSLTNSTAIGAFADVAEPNALVLGGITGIGTCTPQNNCLSVNVGIGTTSPLATLDVEAPTGTPQPTVIFGSASNPAAFKLNGTASFIGAATFGSSVGFLSTQTFPNTLSGVTTAGSSGLTSSVTTGNLNLSLAPCPFGQVLASNGPGSGWACAAVSGGGGGGIGGSGTVNSLPLFSTATSVASSNVYQSSTNTNIGIGTATPQAALDVNGSINLPNTTSSSVGVLSLGGVPFLHNYPGTVNSFNAFIGEAGNTNSSLTGTKNTAAGATALQSNTQGSDNSALGFGALNANTTGTSNSAVGYQALNVNASGSSNSAFGDSALLMSAFGQNNSAFGSNALYYLFSGNNNIALGNNAGYYLDGAESNNIYIGNKGAPGESNTIRIGDPTVQTAAYIAGNLNVSGTVTCLSGCGGGGGGGSGTVTSVAAGTGLVASPSPITSSGTLSINTAVVPQLNVANTFTGNNTFTGTNTFTGSTTAAAITATSLTANTGGFGPGNIYGNNLYLYTANGPMYPFAYASGSSVDDSVFLGFAGENINQSCPGDFNTAIGWRALNVNGPGCGFQAIFNTAVGAQALTNNTVGLDNTATGYTALYQNITGNYNAANGDEALYNNTAGNNNTASGHSSLLNTTGSFNTGSGSNALQYNASGSNNTALGALSGPDSASTGLSYATAIGAGAVVSASNALVLGGPQGSAAAVNVGIGTATPLSPLDVRGNASITGNLNVTGTLSKGAGTFKIDHPLDPANKYLYHSFVESPDMMNVYNGNIATDGSGLATVTLPDWFEALNRDFRYQLTVIGQFAQAIVASEVSHNQFTIRTDRPNVKVSWQVTGIRQDAYANAHRVQVEEDKPPQDQGHYLHPELFGAGPEQAVGYHAPSAAPQAESSRVVSANGPVRPK